MNIVLVKTDVSFELAEDVFIISKSQSSWGGAFSKTKLHWKKSKAALKSADIQFVSEYFITLGMNRIKQSREIGATARSEDGTDACTSGPPKQVSPFDEAEDEDFVGWRPIQEGPFIVERERRPMLYRI